VGVPAFILGALDVCPMNGESYTHTTAHAEFHGVRYDPVNLDRYIPLWRRIWWRLRYW